MSLLFTCKPFDLPTVANSCRVLRCIFLVLSRQQAVKKVAQLCGAADPEADLGIENRGYWLGMEIG